MNKQPEKPRDLPGLFDILALVAAILSIPPNLIVFLIMLIEQLRTGWGFPTNYEMLVLGFWLFQFFTLLPILFDLIYIVVSAIRRRMHAIFILTASLCILSVTLLLLSILFEFN